MPPALLLCCAEELLLGTAVSLQRCPLARSSHWAQEPSPAQQHRPSPRPPLLCPPPRSLHMALGLQWNLLANSLKESLSFPPSPGHTHFLTAGTFLLAEEGLCITITSLRIRLLCHGHVHMASSNTSKVCLPFVPRDRTLPVYKSCWVGIKSVVLCKLHPNSPWDSRACTEECWVMARRCWFLLIPGERHSRSCAGKIGNCPPLCTALPVEIEPLAAGAA